ncbi:hypothetical protein NECAME_01105 [Necator americanus]|uniref:ZP domain-containing protein n=1 Tax=Necator americanus TaxID=51031 RepID=W2SHB2_NECAM|nr:hypothetical protein NECAME_01105 [Necator americanus]ETN68995.1 hypothetical protein NECAME_01105 [Necator americanus]
MLTMLLSLTMAMPAVTAKINDDHIRLDMCRTLLEDELCDQTMPIHDGHYPVTKLNDRLIVRVNPGPHYGIHSEYLPYNCHVLKEGESTTEENAFVLGGCPHKTNVAIYQSKVPVRIEFTMQDVLSEFRTQMSGDYIVKCIIGECSRKEGSAINKCPDYDHCEKGEAWNPDILHVNIHQIPAYIKLRHYPMYRSAHRH